MTVVNWRTEHEHIPVRELPQWQMITLNEAMAQWDRGEEYMVISEVDYVRCFNVIEYEGWSVRARLPSFKAVVVGREET